jgi:sporulation protein YlmC with PRC-barrel domain
VPEGNWDAVYRIDLGGETKLTKEDDTHAHGLKRASDILACNVKNEEGKTVGEIEDLLVRSDGSIAYVEVSTGGFLGMGEDRHAVPLAALAPSDDKTVVLALDDLRLREAPRYPAGARPDPYDTAFDRDLRTYYRVGHLDRIKGVGDGAVVKAGEVIGYQVKNSNGDKVGTLKDIVLDGQTGTIAFGVLSSGGFFGIADKLYAVPWERLRLDPFNQVMYLDTPKETLDRLPGFDDNDWPDFSDAEQRGAIARVFETAGPTAVPTATTVVKASEILDRDVSAAGEEVGKIGELVLDAEQGKVKYAALLLDDEDDKMFAVDWKEIRVGAKDDQVVLNVSPSELKASRGFDKGRWPESAASRRDH